MILSTKLYLSGYLVYKVKSMSQEKKIAVTHLLAYFLSI